MSGQSNTKIIYVGDPMCSWCYGLTNELASVINHFENELDIEFVMGGLRPYYNVPMSQMKDFLADHWQHVNEASGQAFSYGILDREDLNYDTEPPCRAVVAYRMLGGDQIANFFANTQRAFYYDNKDMNQVATYVSLLDGSGISASDFSVAFESNEMKENVRRDFERAAEMGVSSFPTILIEKDGNAKIVIRGYATAEQIISNIEKALK